MDDLIERLRAAYAEHVEIDGGECPGTRLWKEAADEIDRLRELAKVADETFATWKANYDIIEAQRDRLRAELAQARIDKNKWMHEFHATIAEQQAEFGRLRDELTAIKRNSYNATEYVLAIINRELRAELAEARKDAERYRLLRDQPDTFRLVVLDWQDKNGVGFDFDELWEHREGEQIDAICDAFLAKEPQP